MGRREPRDLPENAFSERPVIGVCTNPLAASPHARRILVIRLGAVGDVVRTLPAARAVRSAWPDARLAWLVEPASASLLSGQSWIDDVVVFPRAELRDHLRRGRLWSLSKSASGFARRLREARYDLVLDFHSILKSGVLSWLTRAPRRVAYARPYAREGAAWFATEHARLASPRISRYARNAGLVEYLGVPSDVDAAPLDVPADAHARVGAQAGESAPVAIHPGTSDATPHKRWTREGYARLARELAADGVACIVTSGPARDDRAFAESVVAASGGAARLAPETPALRDLAALLRRCRAYVGGDTGPLHVASMVGTPVVQLLGPTDPIENAPWEHTPSRTVRVQIGCNPCRRGCAAALCMRVIDPDVVIGAARSVLATPEGRC